MSDSAVRTEISTPGFVRLTPVGLSPSDWSSITLAATERLPSAGELEVPFEVFLKGVARLHGILRRLGCAFTYDDGVESLLRTAAHDRENLSRRLSGVDSEPAPLSPSGLARPLRPFQQRDLNHLAAMRHGANFSVPGAGKTAVTYALHLHERAEGRVDKMLVVCPLSAYSAWEEESGAALVVPLTVGRWEIQGGSTDVTLLNYQRLQSEFDAIAGWMGRHNVHLVVDEAHRAKRGVRGEWGRNILSLAPLASRRDVLTGTPAPNHPKDLVALLDITWPGGAASGQLPRAALRADPSETAVSAAGLAIAPLFVRTTKDDLGLPEITFVSHSVTMGPLQGDIYDALLSRYQGMLDLSGPEAADFSLMGEVAMYLIQAASSPQLLAQSDPSRSYAYPSLAIPAGSRLARLVEDYADHETSAKIETAARIVHANATAEPPRKTLVWSNFTGNLLALERQLAALEPALINGSVPSNPDAAPGERTRERELARFKDPDSGCLVLLANPAAMAEGISLHTICHDAIYVDRTFNAGQYLQSLDRIHRLGLPDDAETRIHLLTSEGTIDEHVRRRVEVKSRRLSQMLSDPSLARLALPDDESDGPFFDDQLDLEEVLRHLGGE